MILVTGGIGSGKSVVSNILRACGHEVYDCDSEARRLMDSDAGIKCRIAAELSLEVVDAGGRIDRRRLSELVFSDSEKLAALNAIVHGAVRADLRRRIDMNHDLFVETAIPLSGGLVEMADKVWQVYAPEELRIRRVMLRNAVCADDVRARIEAQRAESVPGAELIVNDGVSPVLPRILELLGRI
ncbi:MAG: dephospho-CoA kinase [Muribaculaceae bacterium]|nr:dephospho-CoA kinase [Muribaculaceae bacterium]